MSKTIAALLAETAKLIAQAQAEREATAKAYGITQTKK